jgi:ankyrin repeat protein
VPAIPESSSHDHHTPIIAAASEGHDAIVDLLVGTGKCDLNKVDKDGTNPLMAASVRGHASIVKKLLSGGSGLNAQNSDGHTALMFAYNGKNQVAMLWDQYKEMLAEAGEEDVEDNAKLIKEALDNHTAVIDLLAASGADATIKDSEGHTAADFDYNPDLDADLVEGEKKSADRRSKSKNEL